MRQRRLRQANLMGPAGLVSLDDSEAMLLSQAGIDSNDDERAWSRWAAAPWSTSRTW